MITQIRLELPDTKYKKTYIEAVKEFKAEQNRHAQNYLELGLEALENDFDAYVTKLHNQMEGQDLPEGFVPATEFWILDDNDTHIGRVHIRHRLTEHLRQIGGHIGYNIRQSERRKGYGSQALQLGLLEARKLGLSKVLVTCNQDNVASRKIIEKNGGVFNDSSPVNGEQIRRYCITL